MQLFSLASVALLALTAVQAKEMSTLHLRVTSGVSDWGACTGGLKCSNPTSVCVKYSQWYAQCKPKTLPAGELCGQNDGTNVWKYDRCPSNQKCAAVGTDFRCTNKKHHHKAHEDKAGAPATVGDWGACTGGLKCSNPTSVCVKYSQWYAQCKPKTLPAGELCGQNDGTNVWKYDRCPSNQKCAAVGTDFRCTNKKFNFKDLEKDESCTITIESQCDGQNWTGSTCCADPSYECRWDDDGQNVKRCQKIQGYTDDYSESAIDDYSESAIDDYSESDCSESDDDIIDGGINGTSYVDSGSDDYTSFVDDWGDCTQEEVGCSNPTSECVVYSDYYAQCKPETLPSGELCGQDDGTNVWFYDACPSGETCEANGSDYRCTA